MGTHVTTAFFTVLPSLASEMSFIFVSTMAEISCGLKVLSSPRYWTLIRGDPSFSTTSKGQWVMSCMAGAKQKVSAGDAWDMRRNSGHLLDIGITAGCARPMRYGPIEQRARRTHSNRRPMRRFASKTVLRGFIAA